MCLTTQSHRSSHSIHTEDLSGPHASLSNPLPRTIPMTKKRSDQPNAELCQFPFSDGRRCRMLRHPRHPQLCPFHAHAELQLQESHQLGAEIATTLTGHFISSADVVHILGKVFAALAQDRIPQKRAATLGYLGQIMLQAMPQVARETELGFNPNTWIELVNESVYPQSSRARNPIHIQSPDEPAAAQPAAPPAPAPAPLHPEGSARRADAPVSESTSTKSPRQANRAPAGVTMPPSSRTNSPLTPPESAHPKNPPISAAESSLPKIRT